MTIDLFIILLGVLAVLTSVFAEGIKVSLDLFKIQYGANIVVLCASVIVGSIGMLLFYIFNDFAFTTLNIICIFLMICANWLVSMIGYDKVMQAITQLKEIKRK